MRIRRLESNDLRVVMGECQCPRVTGRNHRRLAVLDDHGHDRPSYQHSNDPVVEL